MPIRVAVTGATGNMAREVMAAVAQDPGLQLTGALSRTAQGPDLTVAGAGAVPVARDVAGLLARAQTDVLVDFSNAAYAMPVLREAIAAGVRPVVGTSGITDEMVAELQDLCRQHRVGGVFAANFALGAVVMMHLAAVAARHFDSAEIIEMHHDQKADAPSGTAIATAQLMARARGAPFRHPEAKKETLPHPRGAELGGVALHSLRVTGALAHQEVIFGAAGQTLHIRHNAMSRACYMPGVLLAIRAAMERSDLAVGLEEVLGLSMP